MSHYFLTPEKIGPTHQVQAKIWGREYQLLSAPGVFSAHRLDLGTSVLFRETTPPPAEASHLLDLGCGFGPITIALADQCPNAHVDAIDVNDLALELTGQNAARLGFAERVHAMRPDDVPAETDYDEIWSNPPIRVGKEALHELLLRWLPRLKPDGICWLVVGKNLGADSLQDWLIDQGWPAERIASAKGFRILRVSRTVRI